MVVVAVVPDVVHAGAIELRRRRAADIPELLAAIELSIAELSAFLTWAGEGVPSRSQLERSVAERAAAFAAGTGFEYVVRESSTGEVVGEAGGELRSEHA